MLVESLNIGESKTVNWKGKDIKTGIFKSPVSGPIFLGYEDVEGDSVIERKYHGGIDKACYVYNADAYQYWQNIYTKTDFIHGFFGENITISNLDESKIRIGSQYKIGSAIVEVSQPREPCFKLGIRFGSQKILKPFINSPYPGIYLRVISEGKVSIGDCFELISEDKQELTILEVYRLIYGLESNVTLASKALASTKLSEAAKKGIRKRF